MTNLEIYLAEPGILRVVKEELGERVTAEVTLAEHFLPWCVQEKEDHAWLEDLDGHEIDLFNELELPAAACQTLASAAITTVIESGGLSFPGADGHDSRKVFVVAFTAYNNGVEAAKKALDVIRFIESRIKIRDTEFWFPVTHQLNSQGIISQAALIEAQGSDDFDPDSPELKASDDIARESLNNAVEQIIDIEEPEKRRELFKMALYEAYTACLLVRPEAKHLSEKALVRQCHILSEAHTRVVFDFGFSSTDPDYANALNEQYLKLALIEMQG